MRLGRAGKYVTMNQSLDTVPDLDFPIVCQAEVDLPAWLRTLTGRTGWQLLEESPFDAGEAYRLRRGREEAEVVLFHTGHVTVGVEDQVLYEGRLLDAPGCASVRYFHGESGEQITLN